MSIHNSCDDDDVKSLTFIKMREKFFSLSLFSFSTSKWKWKIEWKIDIFIIIWNEISSFFLPFALQKFFYLLKLFFSSSPIFIACVHILRMLLNYVMMLSSWWKKILIETEVFFLLLVMEIRREKKYGGKFCCLTCFFNFHWLILWIWWENFCRNFDSLIDDVLLDQSLFNFLNHQFFDGFWRVFILN